MSAENEHEDLWRMNTQKCIWEKCLLLLHYFAIYSYKYLSPNINIWIGRNFLLDLDFHCFDRGLMTMVLYHMTVELGRDFAIKSRYLLPECLKKVKFVPVNRVTTRFSDISYVVNKLHVAESFFKRRRVYNIWRHVTHIT